MLCFPPSLSRLSPHCRPAPTLAPQEGVDPKEVEGTWYQVDVDVPPLALCLDAVFTDGGGTWDNNNRADFHAPLAGAKEALGVLRLAGAMNRFRAWQAATAEARRQEVLRQARAETSS